MKKISVRTRITLWYIIMLMFFLYLGVVGSYNATRDIIMERHNEGMRQGALLLADGVTETPDGLKLIVFENNRDIFPKDVYYMLFDMKRQVQDGHYLDWMADLPFKPGEVSTIERDGRYLAYFDSLVYKNGSLLGSTRSVVEMTATFELLKEMRRRGTFAIIPSLLLCALGGLIITRWALKPIKKIAKTAKEIGAGNLNKRLRFDTAKDEVGELLVEFNHMADSLQQVIEREKQFSSDASHEIRTPISVIITNAEYAIQSHDLATCEQTLELIINKSHQMQQMLTQLLILARGHEQAQAMELEDLDIASIIEDIAEERLPKAQEKQIAIYTEAEENVVVRADLMLFSRMITNLLDNALQYGRTGGHVNISVYRDTASNSAVILVVDNGIGIAKEELPLIFNRFYRADKSRSRGGAGLGLSFVDFIVKLHKGTISVDSNLDEGTCFKIELPLA